MKFKELIDELEEIIEEAGKLPLSSKCVIDKEDIFGVIEQIRLAYPEDMKQAEYVKKERDRILQDAEKEARAAAKMAKMVTDSEIVRLAKEKAAEILNEAKKEAGEIVAEGEQKAIAVAEDKEKELNAYKDEVMNYIGNILQRAENVSEAAVSTCAKAINDMNSQYDGLRAIYDSLAKNRMAILKK